MEKITKTIEEVVELISFGKVKLCICVNTKECKSKKDCEKAK